MTPGGPMTPHSDLVTRLLRELVTLVRGECPALLNEDSGGDARLSLAIDDALAALPPPADPLYEYCPSCRRLGPLFGLTAIRNEETGGRHCIACYGKTESRLLPLWTAPPTPADPPALVALVRVAAPFLVKEFDKHHCASMKCPWCDLVWPLLAYPLPAAPPVTASAPTYVEIDPDGDLSIDFDRANDRVVSLTVYQDGRVGYSAFVGGKSAHGIVTAAEPMPVWVRAAICAPPVTDTGNGSETGQELMRSRVVDVLTADYPDAARLVAKLPIHGDIAAQFAQARAVVQPLIDRAQLATAPVQDFHIGAPVTDTPQGMDDSRCAVCGWPLDPEGKLCLRGSCSQRPLPMIAADAARAVAEYEAAGHRVEFSEALARWYEQAADAPAAPPQELSR